MVRMTLRLPERLDERIKKRAKDEQASKNTVIVKACEEYVKRYKAR